MTDGGLPERNVEEYLGDGLYASFDGFHIILRAPSQDDGDYFVALEPDVWRLLNQWIERYPTLANHMNWVLEK